MLFSLGPLLDLDAAELQGIRTGAATMLVGSLAAAWYLARAHKRSLLGNEG